MTEPGAQRQTEEPLGLQDEAEDDLCQVVMAVDVRERETVGCCYYVAEKEKLYVLEDIVSGGLEVVETCMHSAILSSPLTLHPDLILTAQ